jgi:alcohol dehydrogenase class IV
LIDSAKIKVRDSSRPVRLVAVPTIWGSGADASPIAVWRDGATRHIEIDDELVPDAAVFVDEFAYTVPVERARDACGDVWAHAIEGFASPLANDELRTELAELINRLLATPTTPDPRWFELSARACAGQAQSGVGLVHGLAHTIEDALVGECNLGHARLCRLMLAPVLDINRRATKWTALFERYGIELDRIQAVADDLFDRESYAKLLPLLEARWPATLRDPCTRTNAVLVRKTDLATLEAWGAP